MSDRASRPRPPRPGETPTSTYRVQLSPEFGFRKAAALVPYLAALGVSHLYASPYLQARPGSNHGYDVIDHNALNPEIGSAEDHARLTTVLREHAMGQIVDFVPNHMGVGSDNRWWLDVLENGPASVYADYFDIDWEPAKRELRHKVLLPVLGDHYGVVLEAGQLVLRCDEQCGSFSVTYHEHRFPVDPASYPLILEQARPDIEARLEPAHDSLLQFQSLIAAFEHLPARERSRPDDVEERQRDKEIHKQRLAELCARSLVVREALERTVAGFNATPGNVEGFRALHRLLEAQAYRLAYWKTAADEINYRRFFDINDLAGLRMENKAVFDATHGLLLQWVREGKVHGIRLDHPDGLYDPAGYFQQLHQHLCTAREGTSEPVRAYLVAEKILASYEHLREDWSLAGTTGYETASLINGLFVDPEAEAALTRTYLRFLGAGLDFDEVLYQSKKRIMRSSLGSELQVLATQLNRISESDPKTRDFTLTALRYALLEVVACFPVYRTYVTPERVAEEDARYVDWAIAHAKQRSTDVETSIFDFIRAALLLELREQLNPHQRSALGRFAMRFQQYTAPVMAKGMEDTAFYIYNRLSSLNEVGGDPRRFGATVGAFHHLNQERVQRWPRTMISSTTHDTKRSEDVRARINLLSEMPREWQRLVTRWRRFNRARKVRYERTEMPSRNDEYLLYQTLLGAWPLEPLDDEGLERFCQRIRAYMLKAAREAKVHTSWINPNPDYEEALTRFVDGLLEPRETDIFLDSFLPFQRKVARLGMVNSLAQCLLKLTSPGAPDVYQGNELWDFSLVDPDNRRRIDYAHRQALLHQLQSWNHAPREALDGHIAGLLENLEDGRAKLYLTWRVLNYRRRYPALFEQGDYRALEAEGPQAERIVGFARQHEGALTVTAVPRLIAGLVPEGACPVGAVWQHTWLRAPGDGPLRLYDVLTRREIVSHARDGEHWLGVQDLFATFPVAFLAGGMSV